MLKFFFVLGTTCQPSIFSRRLPETNATSQVFRFAVVGKSLGHTSLVFSAVQKLTVPGLKTSFVTSDPQPIQVSVAMYSRSC